MSFSPGSFPRSLTSNWRQSTASGSAAATAGSALGVVLDATAAIVGLASTVESGTDDEAVVAAAMGADADAAGGAEEGGGTGSALAALAASETGARDGLAGTRSAAAEIDAGAGLASNGSSTGRLTRRFFTGVLLPVLAMSVGQDVRELTLR
jgi:hypothetical protein